MPPKGKGNVLKYDTFGEEKFHDIPMKELRKMMSSKGLDINGSINDLWKRCRNHAPVMPTKKKYKKLIERCADQPIGLLELL